MIRSLATALLAAALAAPSGAQQATGKTERPRLVVLCVVDQLASWVYDAGSPFLAADGGFRRLQREGTQFAKCSFAHGCTETGPGHATIATGVPARVHGIVRNKWWVGERKAAIYCVDEPHEALPDLPEGKDRGPGMLQAPTLATLMKAAEPATVAASVSWKDRAAILMAGPRADIAVWCELATGNFVTNKGWVAATPAWLTRFNARKELAALFGTTWDRSGPAGAYDGLVDDRPYEAPHGNGRNQHTLPQPLTGGASKPGVAFYAQVYASPFGNTIVREAAEAAVCGMHLGERAPTDLLCVSFSSSDLVGHTFGPDSVEARDTLLRLDQELALLMTLFDDQVGRGRWAMFLTADHGVGPTPEWAREHGIDAGRGAIQTMVGAAAEKALAEALGAPPAGRRFLAHVGEFSVSFDEATLEAVRGQRELAEVRQQAGDVTAAAAAKVRGIAAAYRTDSLLAPGGAPDDIRRSLVDGLFPGRAGDVQLVIKPNWLDGSTPASHGTPHAYDRDVVGFAIGPGVPAGTTQTGPITPGFGAVWFAQMLALPRPVGANDQVPESFGKPW